MWLCERGPLGWARDYWGKDHDGRAQRPEAVWETSEFKYELGRSGGLGRHLDVPAQ